MKHNIHKLFLISVFFTMGMVTCVELSAASSMASRQPPSAALNKDWRFEVPMQLTFGAGFKHGEGVLPDSGALIFVEGELIPAVVWKKRVLRVGMEAAFSQRNTFGFSLFERVVSGGPVLRIRPHSKLDMGMSWDFGYVDRPRWPDSYQPEIVNDTRTGKLLRTDRNSYFRSDLEGYAEWQFHKQVSFELYGGYERMDYEEDPNYNESDSPTHLVPGDKRKILGGMEWVAATQKRLWRASLDFRFSSIRYDKTYARDAQTGLTHAAVGGEAANPLQRFVEFRLRQRNSIRLLKDVLKLVVIEEYTHNTDTFDNYYTWNRFESGASLIFTPSSRWRLEAGYMGSYQRYTENGYAEVGNHPALDNGDAIRDERSHRVDARVETALFVTNVRLFIEGGWKWNSTNFPDYEPNVFPVGSEYLIDWDYVNWDAMGGILLDWK